ncbi:MAG: imidazole glycerol phosphate synthase subunit HisH [Pseudomonadota bacterium]
MTDTITIVDYGSGNLRSVQKAVEFAARTSEAVPHGTKVIVSSAPEEVMQSDRLILPGVGAFRACAEGLAARDGLFEAIEHVVRRKAQPFLGVCVGMQLLADVGLEFGTTKGFGWIPGEVRALPVGDGISGDGVSGAGVSGKGVRSPHMGWNTVSFRPGHPLFDAVPSEADFYFAHSYHFNTKIDEHSIGVCRNGVEFNAAVGHANVAACQFHPEKSQAAGLALIAAFLHWRP